ncbi:arabinose transporter permease [Paenibacillus sp. P3E]|uniref:carbohydrate ABC transporter permease n=1 Tax=unclassified Paenibacillus TaxID=185978 RepID=UPI00093D5C00|nr:MULTISPECIES: sugar ABC transporter permease [unclassified Paenibacillus]OKP72282.1 arabinose transporter permease [Paenibacillus sp. P3E]OKP89717.1 arabinose transporter permease [Paenibacillus sp. P32E]
MQIERELTKNPRRRSYQLGNSQKLAPYVFVLPFLLSFAVFFAYPLINAGVMSFQEVLPGEVSFTGLDNYRGLWNEDFGAALYNSSRYTVWTLLLLIPVPMILAVLLHSKKMPWSNFFRSTLFIPALTSVVVAGVVFRLIFGELDGALMNTILHLFGISSQRWLYSSSLGMFALLVLAGWRWIGINILYFLSALQSIPAELYEAADIDGAGAFRKLIRITIPLLKPITIYVVTITIYGGYAMFTESYMLWAGKPSPQNIGLTIVGYIYQQGFQYFNLGFGSAIGITLLGITLLVSLVQLTLTGMFKKED